MEGGAPLHPWSQAARHAVELLFHCTACSIARSLLKSISRLCLSLPIESPRLFLAGRLSAL